MSEIRFVYAIDPETQAVTRRLADGAAFIAYAYPHSMGFWARHPHVEKFVDTDAGAGNAQVTIRVWTRTGPIEENVEFSSEAAVRHDTPDLEFSGPGLMGDAFWLAHPDIEHVEVFNFLGDDSLADDSWLAKVWLKGGE